MTLASSRARSSELTAEGDQPSRRQYEEREWGMGSKEWKKKKRLLLPTPHSLLCSSLQLFNPRHGQCHSDREQYDDHASGGHRPLRAVMSPSQSDQVGQRADQQASDRRQPDESQRVHTHH